MKRNVREIDICDIFRSWNFPPLLPQNHFRELRINSPHHHRWGLQLSFLNVFLFLIFIYLVFGCAPQRVGVSVHCRRIELVLLAGQLRVLAIRLPGKSWDPQLSPLTFSRPYRLRTEGLHCSKWKSWWFLGGTFEQMCVRALSTVPLMLTGVCAGLSAQGAQLIPGQLLKAAGRFLGRRGHCGPASHHSLVLHFLKIFLTNS